MKPTTVPMSDGAPLKLLGLGEQPGFPWPAGKQGAVPLAFPDGPHEPLGGAAVLLKTRVALMLGKGVQNESQAVALAGTLMMLDCVENHRGRLEALMAEMAERKALAAEEAEKSRGEKGGPNGVEGNGEAEKSGG